jgi:hypothetical protein
MLTVSPASARATQALSRALASARLTATIEFAPDHVLGHSGGSSLSVKVRGVEAMGVAATSRPAARGHADRRIPGLQPPRC